MIDLTEQYIKKVESFSEHVRREAEDAAEKLEALASQPYQNWIDFTRTSSIAFNHIEGADIGDIPRLEKTALNYDATSIDPNQYKKAIWNGEFFDFVLPIIREQIQNGGTGISTETQNAMFDTMRERDLRTLNDALKVAESNVARRGFPLPSSLSQAARQKVITNYQETRDNRSRDITVLIAERAQQSVLALMDKGITIERAQMDFAAGFAKIFLDIGNQILQKFRVEQEARVSEFDGKIKALLSRAEIAKTNAGIDLSKQEMYLKQWELDAQLEVEKTKSLIQQAEHAASLQITAANGLVDFWSSAVASSNSQINAVVSTLSTSTES